MTVKRLTKPPFLTPDDVDDGDVLIIAEAPYLVPADKSKWNKERYHSVFRKDNDEEWGLKTWSMNPTTSDKLLDAFSSDEQKWVGKKVLIRKKEENIGGTTKLVIYGEPYVEPQKKLKS